LVAFINYPLLLTCAHQLRERGYSYTAKLMEPLQMREKRAGDRGLLFTLILPEGCYISGTEGKKEKKGRKTVRLQAVRRSSGGSLGASGRSY